MVLITSFYDNNWKIITKTKNVISKKSVHSNFSFTSYAWLCALVSLHRLYVLNKFLYTRVYRKKALTWPWTNFCSIPLGKCVSKERAIQSCKKLFFLTFESTLHLKSGSMPLNKRNLSQNQKMIWPKKKSSYNNSLYSLLFS